MTKDEALRLALEALENWLEFDPENFGVVDNKAMTAIKAALEAKDEPVATKNNDGVTLHLGWDDLPVGTKLYATPPQRKPLTLEQLREHWKVAKVLDMTDAEIDFADYVLIARDVEALHGIKGEA